MGVVEKLRAASGGVAYEILRALARGPMYMMEIAAELGRTGPHVLHELRKLGAVGLVGRRSEGRRVYYELNEEGVRACAEFFEGLLTGRARRVE